MVRLHALGVVDAATALAGTALCSGCGACERHCHHHVPFPSLLRTFRARVGAPAPAEAPPALDPRPLPGLPRFRTCAEQADGSDGPVACCGHRDGFSSTLPDAARAMAQQVARHFGDAPFACASATCTAWLRENGARVVGPGDPPPVLADAPPPTQSRS